MDTDSVKYLLIRYARYRFECAHALQCFVARLSAKFYFSLKIRTHFWTLGPAENATTIVVVELHAALTREFAFRHTGNCRADTQRDTTGAATGSTRNEMRGTHKFNERIS